MPVGVSVVLACGLSWWGPLIYNAKPHADVPRVLHLVTNCRTSGTARSSCPAAEQQPGVSTAPV
jgi:hypothetical protein